MRIVLFCHSLVSDWNHGNAHFLRGVVAELLERGHQVDTFEPVDGWSRTNLLADQGEDAINAVYQMFPWLVSTFYDPAQPRVEDLVDGADLVIVHEWTDPGLVARLGRHRDAGGYRLLFHDTHHRSVTKPAEIPRYDLPNYDGVLAFGEVIRQLYLSRGWAARAWTWHEAADTRVFAPVDEVVRRGDVVWIGNWGDEERARELADFLIDPVAELGLRGGCYGVRYPAHALQRLRSAGIDYGGWIANHRVPATFAAYGATVHIPRRPYVAALPGIPTIRPFEALACGIPLVSAPWDDVEGLFDIDKDFLMARNGREMRDLLDTVLHDQELALSLSEHGRATIQQRHTCAHRVDELLAICRQDLGLEGAGQGDGHG